MQTNVLIDQKKSSRLTIGMLIDRTQDQYQSSIIQGVADHAKNWDINLLCFEGGIINSPIEYEARRNVVYDLVNQNIVDGLIILSNTIGHYVDNDTIKKFCEQFSPLPMISIALEIPNIHSIIPDNFGGMRDMIAHLIETHGCQNFAFIKGLKDNQDAEERFKAFQETLLSYNLKPDPELIVQGDFETESGKDAVGILLDERKVKFDVLVACNDDMALGALNELKARGINVPDDVAITGFDNLDYSVHITPPLTTISYSLYAQGWWAMDALLNLIEKKEVPQQIVLPAKLIPRRSCGCFSHRLMELAFESHYSKDTDFKEVFQKNKEILLAEIIQETHYLFNSKTGIDFNQLVELLLDGFYAELYEQNGRFIKELNAVLKKDIWSSRDISLWQTVITKIYNRILPYLTEDKLTINIGDVWLQARALIGEMALVKEELFYQQHIEENKILYALREELLLTLDQTQILNILAELIPDLGIKSCYLMMFKEEGRQNSKLIMAYNENGRIDLSDSSDLPSNKLLPYELLPKRRYSMLIEALDFSAPIQGLAMFELDSSNMIVFTELRKIICSSLQAASLFKQIQDQANHLQIQKESLSHNLNDLRKMMSGFIEAIVQTVETRDPYTAGHQHRVADLARSIATEMKLPRDKIEGIRTAGIVHDLGKLSIPAEILNKPGRLKEPEFNLIKSHPEVAYEILKNIDFPWPIAQIVLQHHERLDGSGYPSGLKEADIMLEAKILSVADVVEAMSSNRPYRPSLGIDQALEEIINKRGLLYDSIVVDTCLRLFREKGFKFK